MPTRLDTLGTVDLAATIANATKISPTGGSKTVAASGTAEALVASSTMAMMLYVRAKGSNTGNIYFGDSNVDKTTSQQVILSAGQSVSVDVPAGYKTDVTDYWIDADTNGEGVDYLYIA